MYVHRARKASHEQSSTRIVYLCYAENKPGNRTDAARHPYRDRNNRNRSDLHRYREVHQVWARMMENQVGPQLGRVIVPPCCAACRHRNGVSEFYATCIVLARKNWSLKDRVSPIVPFWATGQALVPDMTTRTLAIEGKNCRAYSVLDTATSQ